MLGFWAMAEINRCFCSVSRALKRLVEIRGVVLEVASTYRDPNDSILALVTLLTTFMDYVCILDSLLSYFHSATKLFETGSLASVFTAMISCNSWLIDKGASTAAATSLLKAVYGTKSATSGSVGHRNRIPSLATLPDRISAHYDRLSTAARPLILRGSHVEEDHDPVWDFPDDDSPDDPESVIGAEFALMVSRWDAEDREAAARVAPETFPGIPVFDVDVMALPSPEQRAFMSSRKSADAANALLASMLAYGIDALAISGYTQLGSGTPRYLLSSLLSPAVDVSYTLSCSSLDAAVKDTIGRRISRAEVPLRGLIAPPPSVIASSVGYRRREPDAGNEYDRFLNRAASFPISDSSSLVSHCEWWMKQSTDLPAIGRIALPLMLISASSSDSERAGSNIHGILGIRATTMGVMALRTRSFMKANMKLCLREIKQRYADIITVGVSAHQKKLPRPTKQHIDDESD